MKQIIYSLIITVISSILMFAIGADDMNMIFLVFCSIPVVFTLVLVFLILEYFTENYYMLLLYASIYFFVLINLGLMFGLESNIEWKVISNYLNSFYEISGYIYVEVAVLSLLSSYAKLVLLIDKEETTKNKPI
jgi:hypothetical protein